MGQVCFLQTIIFPSDFILTCSLFFPYLVLEVMQFARDAHLAEGWLITQESYLKNENLGVSQIIFHSSIFLSYHSLWTRFGETYH